MGEDVAKVTGDISYLARYKKRREEQAKLAVMNATNDIDGLSKDLRAQYIEYIRQGVPPPPFTLTTEEDAQLVKEGVLPPDQ
jgi:hypothetical protein